ncbi:MAG: (2Fe-2S)-binding protein [Phycisphaerae bacterium]|nr:(2Fe-2S)-binding protein [Phycisphaerae bacterium]
MPRVVIDNQEVEVTPGSNLLAAARKLKIDVPALCYHPACTPNTSCMACLMKIKDTGRIVPSCATLAEDGMVVESETDEIRQLRRAALELLLSDHAAPVDEKADGYPYCDCEKRDLCRLRKYAELYGADPARYRGSQRKTERTYHHPEITYDPRKCILCGICIQLAQQAGEPLGLTLIGRGFDVRVDVPLDEPLEKALQTAARRCAGACPTGALSRRRE